jgi:hypothetical protein
VVVTPGQRHESTQLGVVLDTIRAVRPKGCAGRPRKRPEHLIADRGFSFPRCRRLLRRRGIPHTIPERRDQRERRAGRVPWKTAKLRPGRLPEAQRGGAVRESAKTVAGNRHALREAGKQLPSDRGHRRAADLANNVVNHCETHSSPQIRAPNARPGHRRDPELRQRNASPHFAGRRSRGSFRAACAR